MFKIRYKLMLVLLGISLLPQIIINQISFNQIEKTVYEKFNREADYAAESIQKFMSDTLRESETNILGMERNIQYVYGNDMKIVQEDLEQLLRIVQESSGSTPNFYVGTSEGEMFLYPEDILPKGYDPRLRSWYQMAMLSKDKINWFGPYIDQGTKQLVLTVSKYYQYKNKEGVVGIDILLTDIRESLKTKALGANGEMFIIDGLGEIILHKNPSFEGLNLKYTKYINSGINRALELGNYSGERYSFKIVGISENLYVVTVIDKKEVNQLVNQQMNQIRTVPLIFFAITFGIILFFAKRITRPLYILIDGMKKAEQGDYEVQVNYKGNDEMMLLINQFNKMSQSIHNTKEEMTAIYEELSASEETLQDQYDELVRNRDQIAESERRYKLVFESSNEGLWDIDSENQLKNYSPNWFKNYFSDKEKKTLDDWIVLIHEDDRHRFEDSLHKHINHLTPYFHEFYRVKDLTGQYRLIQSRGKAEFDVDGELITLAGSHLDVTDQKSNEAQILKMAYFDQITELANRRNFERELDKYFNQHQWGRIIYIDIDAFKNINEDNGYMVGDQVLKDLANRLKQTFKDAFIARVAGDEFAVVLGGAVDEEHLSLILSDLNNNSCQIQLGDVALDYRINVVQCKFPNEGKNTDEIFSTLLNRMKLAKVKIAEKKLD